MKSKTKKANAIQVQQSAGLPAEEVPSECLRYKGNQEWIAEEMAAGGKFSWIS